MKKLFNSRFLFILASSLVVLIGLTVGAFYLFDDEDATFVKGGYVLNPLSSTSEKYFFDENAGYKENLSSMIEFEDVDKNTVSILKDSFIHYLDDSLSFLKRGAILDLDSLDGGKVVSFYNITNESIIEKKDGSYVIESANGEIKLKNFIGRISDDKYIVVGDLSLKMAGNSASISGDYFEIVYVEEGIVNIENKDVKYQVAAEGTQINVGNDKVINLGDKKITVKDIDVMSLTSITINGDENIDIIPKGNEEDEGGSNGGVGNSSSGQAGPGDAQGGTGNGDRPGDSGGDGTTDGPGEGGTGEGNIETEDREDIVISLKDVSIGSTNIDVTFDVVNASNDDKLMLQVVNLASGRTVDMVAQVLSDVEIKVNLLTPNTKYLFMVINEKDNNKYFQKVLETTGFGIKLEKGYATDSSLSYKITVDEGTDITNAKLTLYKFNEETMQNEIVTDSYEDVDGEVKTIEKVVQLSSLKENIEGEHDVVFDGLDSNTIYTAVLDEFSVASSNFKDIYNITVTAMTLKKIPNFNEMLVTKNVGEGSFDLSLSNIDDPDNAIVKYTYMVYNRDDDKLAVKPIEYSNASPIKVMIGDKENQLKNDTNYYYKVVIEYFDNEKYIEYITTDSITFMMGEDPYITVVPNEKQISYDSIGATIYLIDNSCLVSMPGREKCNSASTTVVEVSRVNPITGERTTVYTDEIDFDVSEEGIKYNLFLDGLQASTTYNIEVKSVLNKGDSSEPQYIMHTDESKRTIATKSLSSFNVEWTDKGSSETHVVNVQSKFLPVQGTGTMSPEETANSLKQVVISLYEGDNVTDLDRKIPIARKFFENTANFNIKENFYDKGYVISTKDTFGLSIDALKDKSDDGELSEYYTVLIEAYFDNKGVNDAKLFNNVIAYKISPALLMEDVETILEIKEITNTQAGGIFDKLVNGGTVVGYKVTAAFDKTLLESSGLVAKKVNYYVYNSMNGEQLNFYIKNKDGKLVEVNKVALDVNEDTGNYFDLELFMDYGSSYEEIDKLMKRGNYFFVGYEIEAVDKDNKTWLYPMADDPSWPSDYGMYEQLYVEKETPTLKMYATKSTADSITYSYDLRDPDNAVYKEVDGEDYYFYYKVNSGSVDTHALKLVDDAAYSHFSGKITINGLKNSDMYSIYYKKNALKSGVFETDIVDYSAGPVSRYFDGYYNLSENADTYNFKYQIINNPLKDNRVVIKILANDNILDRILSYRLSFKDSKGNTLNKELWKLTTCSDDSSEKCLSVDYIELKDAGMKSEVNETNLIKVTVTALYDNGLMGYDYKVGTSSNSDFKYCIMQDNSTDLGIGKYIVFSSTGREITTWSESIDAPKGYYSYSLANSLLYYKSELNSSYRMNISVNLSESGYLSKNGVLNPKMVSVDEMECKTNNNNSCDSFSFSSITPKVLVKENTKLINGAVINLTLSGIDLADVENEGTASNPEYYLYIETWDNVLNAGDFDKVVRPTIKVKISNDRPTNMLSAVIDGLKEYNASQRIGTYYFNVYANMYKDGKVAYTQLFDASVSDKYDVKTYSFDSAKPSDLFRSLAVGYTASDQIYGNRTLNTRITLYPYKNNVPYNFDLVYVMCEIDDVNKCGPGVNDVNIFKKEIPLSSIGTTVDDDVDISSFDLEFNKQYNMFLYAITDFYEGADDSTTKRNIVLNRYDNNIKLKKLAEPSFNVTRNAVLEDGEYSIDFNIVVNDSDRTLVDGNYFIKLLNDKGQIVGNMQLLDEDGNYYDVTNYDEYAFDAFVVNKKVRITGLDANAKYTFTVYNDAYINNYDENTKPGRDERTFEISKSYTVYSTNNYGVAFGTATYGVTSSSVIVTFLGGSNFANVVEVNYTVGLWDDDHNSSTLSGTFAVGDYEDKNVSYEAIKKSFELYMNSEDWRFVIDPNGMKNILGKTYQVILSFKLKVPGTDDRYVVLTNADVESFKGTVTYYEDEKKK